MRGGWTHRRRRAQNPPPGPVRLPAGRHYNLIAATGPAVASLFRGTTKTCFTGWGVAPNAVVLDAALLIVTELALNCVRHAADRSPHTELILDLGGGNLQVAVADTHPWAPGILPANGGLRVIDDLVRDFDGHLVVDLADAGPGKTIRVVLPVTSS